MTTKKPSPFLVTTIQLLCHHPRTCFLQIAMEMNIHKLRIRNTPLHAIRPWDSSGASSEFTSQKASPTSLHMQHPQINYETTPPLSDVSATNVLPRLFSAHPPCTSSHSHSSRFPSSHPVDSLLSSAMPSMYSQSDDIIGSIELESSLTSALTFNNLPYANLSADERSGTKPQARGVAVHQELSYSR